METLTFKNGDIISLYKEIPLKGCITNSNSLWGTVDEFERILEFHKGRLKQGFFIARLTRLPQLHEFNLGGYTNKSIDRSCDLSGSDLIC